MTELKGRSIDRFLKAPDPATPIILIHGPDRGRVQLRMRELVHTLAGDPPDPMSHVELDPVLLESEPSRLAEEADSVAMFGGNKVVSARMDEPKALTKVVETLLERPPSAAWVLIAAGDLKKGHPLRGRIEKASSGVAIACYASDVRDIGILLQEAAKAHGLTVDADARDDVLARLGADHALSVAEIEKLCLYARKDGAISLHHVDASLADSSAHALGDVADQAFAGRRDAALDALRRSMEEGLEPSVITQSLMRHARLLERLRLDMDGGSSADMVIGRARPPVFFKRRAAIEHALRNWSANRLRSAANQLDEDLVQTRLAGALKAVRVERQILRIASEAARFSRR